METETGAESGIESGVEGGVVPLTFAEARVLGCLIEKELTTPEYYPLTSGALTAACNQKSNRDPVVEWDEREVMETVESLRLRKLALMQRLSGARVPKYRHAFHEVYGGMDGAMMAVLCELLVRNVQTFGELRTRAGRMHAFPDLEAVEAAVQRLVDYPGGGLVVVLPPSATGMPTCPCRCGQSPKIHAAPRARVVPIRPTTSCDSSAASSCVEKSSDTMSMSSCENTSTSPRAWRAPRL